MAKYIGLLTSDMRGTLGGVVATRGRSGTILRARVSEVKRPSTARLFQRAIFSQASQAWAALSPGDMSAWRDIAAAQPRVNTLGQRSSLTGPELYTRLCINLTIYNGVFTAPPGPGVSPSVLGAPVPASFGWSLFFFQVRLGVIFSASIADPNVWVNGFNTGPLSPGVLNFPKKTLLLSGGVQGGLGGDSILFDLGDPDTGYVPLLGQTVGIALQAIDLTYGFSGPKSYALAPPRDR